VATEAGTSVLADLPDAFVAAMNEDLGTSAALAVLHDTVREGNRALAAEDTAGAAASESAQSSGRSVLAMLDVLGLHPHDPAWATGASDVSVRLEGAVDGLVAALLEQRTQARADKDFATADAIRDRIKAAGIEIEDTPAGPRWSLGEPPADT